MRTLAEQVEARVDRIEAFLEAHPLPSGCASLSGTTSIPLVDFGIGARDMSAQQIAAHPAPGQIVRVGLYQRAAHLRQWAGYAGTMESGKLRPDCTPAQVAECDFILTKLQELQHLPAAAVASLPRIAAPSPVTRPRMTAAEARAEIAASERAAATPPASDRAFTPAGRASLALHEAGHALAYLVARRGLVSVSIAPASTHFTGGPAPAWCVAAGPVAARMGGLETECGARYSAEDQAQLRAALARNPGQTRADAEAAAQEVLAGGWAGVQALAAVLLRVTTVSGADATRILAHANAVAAEGGTYFKGHATFTGLYAA